MKVTEYLLPFASKSLVFQLAV